VAVRISPAGIGDPDAWPFAAGVLHVALLARTLEFLPSLTRVLREQAQVARRGIVLGVLNRWNPLAWRTNLLPRIWLQRTSRLPIGGSIGMRVVLSDQTGRMEERLWK